MTARRAWALVLGIAAAGGFVLLYAVNPAGSRVFPQCVLRAATGLYCPGCGSLRAMHQLLHGHLGAAFRLNPLMVLSLPVLGLLLMFPRWAYRPWVAWCALAVLLVYSVLRNIPLWPFDLLAPR